MVSLNRWLILLSALIGVTSVAANKADKIVTRDLLMKGITIPEKRSFPLSTKVSPCEDFHKYVCSEVEEHFKLPADRVIWTFAFSDSAERLLQAKRNYFLLLGKGYKTTTERAGQFKDVYNACMKTDKEREQEKFYVKQEITAIDAVKSREDLLKFLANRIDKPDYTFISFDDLPNQDDPSINDLMLITHMMSLPERSYYKKEDLMKDFRALGKLFFETLKLKDAEKRANAVIDLEKEFAEVNPLPAEMRQRWAMNTYLPRDQWLSKYPNYQLEAFFKTIPANTKIRDVAKESMAFVNEALAKNDVQVLKDMVLFHSLKDTMDEAYPKFFKAYFDFRKKYLGGPEKRPPLQERCTKLVMGSFGMELDNELLPILFPNFPEDRVINVAERTRKSIIDGLRKNTWLSSEARKEAIKKIEVASLNLVKPHRAEDWDFLPMQKYDANAPITNMKKIQQAGIQKIYDELKEKRNRNRWGMPPLTVNAYYSPPDNHFMLMQGILQYPFFDANQSDIENTGSTGSVVGHELGHGIDDQGSQYDADGKLARWMTTNDLAEFSKRGGQFVERFDKLGHNGRLTLGENIGDHVGITFAFHAAFPDPEKASQADIQKFFVAYARAWCTVATPGAVEAQIKTNPHAMGWARINGQVVEHDAFAKAFSCKAGDKMYIEPKDRIRVW